MDYQYKCNYCVKSYKEKFNYERHVSVCKYLSQTPRQQINEVELVHENVPSNAELFQLVKHLSVRLDKLEKENHTLRQKQNKKKNVLEWLNSNAEEKPVLTFEKWLVEEVQIKISSFLEAVFKRDLVHGVVELFQKYLEKKEDVVIPICCFTNKSTSVYIYEKNVADETQFLWKMITMSRFDEYIEHICQQFIIVFLKEWCEPNQELIATKDKYKDMYAEYYQKILGGTTSKDVRCSKIRNSLQTLLKRNISSIIEYECE